MNFTNTDCVWIREVLNMKVIDQVCQEERTKVVSRLNNPVMEIHSQIRRKIYREGCIVDWFDLRQMNFTDTDCVTRLDDWDIPEEFWESEAAEVFWQVFHVTYQIKYKITKINKI
jgi:hypothetical protein